MEGKTQVLVIGGGPAGSTAATLLARQGFEVALLEREVFPRYHIGESLLVALNHIFDVLGLREKLEAHGFQEKTGAFFEWGTERWCFDWSKLPGTYRSSFQVKRDEFDQLLLEHAKSQGVKVHEGVTVRSLAFDGDRPVRASWQRLVAGEAARGEISFDYLVDASGRSGVMANRYLHSRRHNEAFQNLAVWGYWKGVAHPDVGLTGPILVASVPEGWLWVIPLHDGTTSVGLVLHEKHFQERRKTASIMEIYREGIASSPLVTEALAPGEMVTDLRTEGDYSYLSEVLAGPGFFLCGDSAAFLDPLLSSGVHLATYSGLLAAACLGSVIRGEMTEEEATAFYGTCYREHYLRWMLIVSTFYDQYSGKESYFWEAQRLSTGDLNAADAKLAFTHVVAGIEDLKEARQTELLQEVSTRMRENLGHHGHQVVGTDVGEVQVLESTPFSDLIKEEDLRGLPAAMGFRVVTEPVLKVVRVAVPVGGVPDPGMVAV
ncbi:MAG TPA: NAD(P)/FAD-dependent oxidoreductase [Longimicrobiaceae bacterium]